MSHLRLGDPRGIQGVSCLGWGGGSQGFTWVKGGGPGRAWGVSRGLRAGVGVLGLHLHMKVGVPGGPERGPGGPTSLKGRDGGPGGESHLG